MSSIDERVVRMRFDNDQFEAGAKQTMSTLDKIKQSLNFKGVENGIAELDKSFNTSSLKKIESGVMNLTKQFSFLGMAINKVKANVIDFGLGKIKTAISAISRPLQQIQSGGWNRAMNIENARFQIQGMVKDASKFNDTWTVLSKNISAAVDGTAYGFDSAAKAAAQFMASGIKAGDQMEHALRGISGVAAMTNSSYDDIARVFTQVAGQGRVMGNDLMQLSARGINVAATLGEALGKTEGDIRKMVSKGQIDFKTFSEAMNNAFGEHATKANETYEGSLSNVRAALSKIGAIVAEVKIKAMIQVFNNLRQSINALKNTITPFLQIYNAFQKAFIEGMAAIIGQIYTFDKAGNAIFNPILKINDLLAGLANIFFSLLMVLTPIKKAFNDAFPKASIKTIGDLNTAFLRLTEKLIPSEKLLNRIEIAARGLFTGIGFGISVIKSAVSVVSRAIGPILSFISQIIGKVSEMKEAFSQSDIAKGAFGALTVVATDLSTALKKVIKYASAGFGKVVSGVKRINFGNVSKHITTIAAKVKEITASNPTLSKMMGSVSQTFKGGFFTTIVNGIAAIAEKAVTIGKEFADLPIFKKIITDLQTLFTKIASVGGPVLTKILDFIHKFISEIKMFSFDNLNAGVVKVWDTLRGFFEFLGSGASGMGRGIIDLFTKIKESITGLGANKGFANSMKDFTGVAGANAADSMSGLTTSFGDLTKSIKDFVDGIDWDKVRSVIHTVLSITTWLSVIKVINSVANATNNLATTFRSVNGVFDALTKTINSWARPTQQVEKVVSKTSAMPVLLQFAILIGSVTASLAILANIPKADLEKARDNLLIVTGVISAIGAVLALLNNKLTTNTLLDKGQKMFSSKSGIARNIIALSASLFLIASALNKINDIDLDVTTIEPKVVVMSMCLLALGGAAAIIDGFGKGKSSIKAAINVLALAVSMKMIVGALTDLTKVSYKQIWAAVVAFIGISAGLGMAAALMSNIGAGGAIAMIAVVMMFDKFVPYVQKLSEYDYGKILVGLNKYRTTIIMLAAIGALIAVVSGVLGKGIKSFGTGLLLMSGSLLLLAKICKTFDGLNESSILKGTNFIQSVLTMIAVLVGVSALTKGVSFIKMGLFLAQVTVSIGLMALIAKRVGEVDEENLAKGTVMVGLLTAMINSMMRASAHTGTAKLGPMIAAITGLTVLMVEVVSISYYPFKQMIKGIFEMGLITAAIDSLFLSIRNMDAKPASIGVMWAAVAMLGVVMGGLYVLTVKGANFTAITAMLIGMIELTAVLNKTIKTIAEIKDATWGEVFRKVAIVATATAAVAAIAYSLAALSKNGGNWKSIIASAAGVSLVLFTLSSMFDKMGKLNRNPGSMQKYANAILTASLSIIAIALPLTALATQDWDSILAAAVSIDAVLLGLNVTFQLMSKIQPGKAVEAAGVILLASLAVIPIAIALGKIASYDWKSLLAAAVAVTATLGGLSLLCAALGKLGPESMLGGLYLDVIAAELIGGVIGLGYILKKLDTVFDGSMISSINFLGDVFEAIGQAFGKLISGFVSGLTEKLYEIGINLSIFMLSVQPFIEMSKNLDSLNVEGIKNLVIALLYITAAELISGLENFLSAFLGLDGDLADRFTAFGEAIGAFAESVKDLPDDLVERITKVAEATGILAGTKIPTDTSKSIVGFIMGTTSYKNFGENLASYGESLKAFDASISGLSEEFAANVDMVAKATKAMADVKIPTDTEGSFLGMMIGTTSFSNFGENLKSFGSSLRIFGQHISSLGDGFVKKVDLVKGVADTLISIDVPTDHGGSLWGLIWGDDGLGNFGDNIADFGSGLVSFDKSLGSLSKDFINKIKAVQEASTLLADISSAVFTGFSTGAFANFANDMTTMGTTIAQFVDNLSAVDFGNMTTIRSQITIVKNFIDELLSLASMDLSSLQTFEDNLTSIGDLGISGLVKAFTDTNNVTSVKLAIASLLTNATTSLSQIDFGETVEQIIGQMVGKIKSKYQDFYDSGAWLGEGLAKGIASKLEAAKTAGASLAIAANEGIESAGRIASPSKLTQESGHWMGQGLIVGVKKEEKSVFNAGISLANSLSKGIDDRLGIHCPADDGKDKAHWEAEGVKEQAKKEATELFKAGKEMVDPFSEGTKESAKKGIDALGEMFNDVIGTPIKAFEKWAEDGKNFAYDTLGDYINSLTGDAGSNITGGVNDLTNNIVNSAGKAGKAVSKATKMSAEDLNMLAKYFKYTSGAAEEFAKLMNNVSDTMLNGATRSEVAQASIAALAERIYKANLEIKGEIEDTSMKAEERTKKVKETFVDMMDSIKDSIQSSFNLFEEFDHKFDKVLKPDKLMKNMSSQFLGMAQLPALWNQLAMRGLNFNWLKEMIEKGTEALPEMRSLLELNAEQFEEANENFAKKQEMANEIALQAASALAVDMARETQKGLAAQGDEMATAAEKWFEIINKVNNDVFNMQQRTLDVKEAAKKALGGLTDYFSDFGEVTVTSSQDAIKALESNRDAMIKWRDNLLKLKDMGASDGLIDYLMQQGIKGGYGLIQGLAQGSKEELSRVDELFTRMDPMKTEIAEQLGNSYYNAGTAAIQQLVMGMNTAWGEDPAVLEAIQQLPEDFLIQLTEQLQNGEIDYSQVGQALMNGIGTSIEEKSAETAETGRKAGEKTSKAVEDGGVKFETGYGFGNNLGQGVAAGIRDSIKDVIDAAQALADAATNAITGIHAWDEHSPSKTSRHLAQFFGQGIVLGFQDTERDVYDAAGVLSDSTVSALQMAIAAANDSIENDTDLNPVITPVLDLSEIESGSSVMSSMLTGDSFSLNADANLGNVQIADKFDIASMLRSAVSEGLSGFTGGQTVHNDFNIVVNAAPGQDPTEIAEAVRDQLTGEVSRKVSAFA